MKPQEGLTTLVLALSLRRYVHGIATPPYREVFNVFSR